MSYPFVCPNAQRKLTLYRPFVCLAFNHIYTCLRLRHNSTQTAWRAQQQSVTCTLNFKLSSLLKSNFQSFCSYTNVFFKIVFIWEMVFALMNHFVVFSDYFCTHGYLNLKASKLDSGWSYVQLQNISRFEWTYSLNKANVRLLSLLQLCNLKSLENSEIRIFFHVWKTV